MPFGHKFLTYKNSDQKNSEVLNNYSESTVFKGQKNMNPQFGSSILNWDSETLEKNDAFQIPKGAPFH